MFFSKKEKIFRKVYSENFAVILNIISAKVSDPGDAEDICHDLFVTLYKKFDEIDDPVKWLKGAVRFEVLGYYRKKGKKNGDISIDEFEGLEFEARGQNNDLRIIMKDAVENKDNFENDRERLLFDLIAVNKYSYTDAARELGITRRQAEYAYGKVANRIMNYLKNRGVTPEGVYDE